MIGTPSQYKKEKMFGKPPDSLPKGSYFLRTPEGSLYVKPYEDQYVIRDVFVKEEERGKGFGRQMMVDIIDFLLPKKRRLFFMWITILPSHYIFLSASSLLRNQVMVTS